MAAVPTTIVAVCRTAFLAAAFNLISQVRDTFNEATKILGNRTDYLEDETIEQAARMLANARIQLANLTEFAQTR